MRSAFTLRLAVAALGLAVLGCSPEATTAPLTNAAPPPAAALLGLPLPSIPLLSGGKRDTVHVVRRKSPLQRDITVTKTIGALGGTIAIPDAGLVVTFLPAAVLGNTRITVTAYAGSFVSYGFGPHGIHFLAPVVVTQDIAMTTAADGSVSTFYGAYTPDGQSDILANGTALVSELLNVKLLSLPLLGKLHILSGSFTIQHFSGYILASG